MKMSDEQIEKTLKQLRRGGLQASELFIEVARQCYEDGRDMSVSAWVNLAAPALPEADKHETLKLLLNTLFADFEIEAEIYQPHPTVQ